MAIDAALGRLGIRSGVCTSSTRPTNPYSGQLIYETDTNRTLVYDNAAWLVVADNQVLSIDSANGRVGVGTTAPETPLTIDTTNKLGSSFTGNTAGEGLRVVQTNYASGNYVSLVEGTYDDFETAPNVRIGAMYDGGGSQLSFGTSNSYGSGITNEALAITSEGNVGVNDISPSYTLDVNGDINATGDLRIGGTAIGTTTTYTPTFTNFTVSSHSVQYSRVGKLVFVRFYLTVSAVTGTPIMTVPSGVNIFVFPSLQQCQLTEVGVINYVGTINYSSATSVNFGSSLSSGTYLRTSGINGSIPFGWGAGDIIAGGFWYLAV